MTKSDPASQFIGLYVAVTNYAKTQPPDPFARAIGQAVAALAPLAAEVLIQDKLAQQTPPEAPIVPIAQDSTGG